MPNITWLQPLQFFHAWLLSRVVGAGAARHTTDDSPMLVVAPHPDDETLGCGGIIATKRAMGVEVTVVFLTDGAAGTLNECPGRDPNLAARRQSEAVAATANLGVPPWRVHFWNYPDGGLSSLSTVDSRALVERLANLMRAENIRTVYVPHQCDGHADHRQAFHLTRSAAGEPGVSIRLFQYPIWMWWSQPLGWRLRWKDIGGGTVHHVGREIHRKSRALSCHASQLGRFPPGFIRSLPWGTELFFEEQHCRQTNLPAAIPNLQLS